MSKRADRLNTRAAELRTLEQVAQVRVRNAERGLVEASGKTITFCQVALRAELEAARTALRPIHHEQQRIVEELDWHTIDMPDLALVLIEDPNGHRVVERRCNDGTGTSETNWFDLGAPDDTPPMNFNTAIGVTPENPYGHHFSRLYTQDEVDDLMDEAQGF